MVAESLALILGMASLHFFKNLRFLPLLALPVLVWLAKPASGEQPPTQVFSSEKINLALRRTADRLLREAGDSTSRIPAVEQASANVWRLRLDRPFRYENLPPLLEASLELHEIHRPYRVAVRRCDDSTIDLGYHKFDFTKKIFAPDTNQQQQIGGDGVPCLGRDLPDGCHFIEITFLENEVAAAPLWSGRTCVLLLGSLLILVGAFSFWSRFKRDLASPPAAEFEVFEKTDGLKFGNSRLDIAGQLLDCGDGSHQNLTFRETKLLRLFAENPGKLLEREFILQQVWADEGVLVGRSVDVFVSRLRKKLAADPTLSIVAVHGVGYRLEIK